MQPWEHKKWRGGVLRPVFGQILLLWLFALIFTGIGIGVFVGVEEIRAPELNAQKMLLIFLAVGLLALYGALLKTFRQLHYRGAELRVAPMPGVIGGTFSGELLLPGHFGRNARIQMLLASEATISTRRGKETSVNVQRLYQDQLTIPAADLELRRGGCAAPFKFIIPFGQHDETENSSNCKYRWLVRVWADVEGFNLNLEFKVPVFKTPQSDPSVRRPERSAEELDALMSSPDLARGVATSLRHGRTSYLHSGAPSPAPLLLLLIMSALFGGATVFLLITAWHSLRGLDPGQSWLIVFDGVFAAVPLIMALVFGLLTLLMLLGSVWMFIRRETWIADGVLHQQCALLVWNWKHSIRREQIRDVFYKQTGAMGDTRYFAVCIEYEHPRPRRMSKRRLDIAGKITNEAEGQWLVKELKSALQFEDQAEDAETDES